MPIQDDVREDVLIAQFGLIKYSSHSRGEFDASDHNNNKFELKSTTTNTVSTARDFSDKHIIKWRKQYFIIGQWDESVAQYKRIYFLAPIHMSKWLNDIEYKVNQRKDIATRVMNANVVYEEERKKLRKKHRKKLQVATELENCILRSILLKLHRRLKRSLNRR